MKGLEFSREPPDSMIARPPHQGNPAKFRARPPVQKASPPEPQSHDTAVSRIASSNGHPAGAAPEDSTRAAACEIAGCDRPRKGRGLCSAHYKRWQTYGDAMPDVPIGPAGGRVRRLPDRQAADPPTTPMPPADALALAISAAHAADEFDAAGRVERAHTAVSRAQAWLLIHERLREQVVRDAERGGGAGSAGHCAVQRL